MSELFQPFTSPQFVAGLVGGLAGLGLGGLVGFGWRRWRREPAPIVGVLLTVAVLGGIPAAREVPPALLQGLAMLAAAGLAFPFAKRIPGLVGLLAVPGAWWITQQADLPVDGWPAILLFATIVIGAPLVASFDAHHADRGLGPVLLAVTVFGGYATLPDTEEVLVVLGAALPLALLAWPRVVASLGAWGVYPVVGVIAWVIAWGGRGRETAIIGAAAAFGLLLVEPVVRLVRGESLLDRLRGGVMGPVAVGLLQAVTVFMTARVAGLQSSPLVAGAVAVLALGVAGLVLTTLSPRQRSGRHSR